VVKQRNERLWAVLLIPQGKREGQEGQKEIFVL
jgi:hypothetical protein